MVPFYPFVVLWLVGSAAACLFTWRVAYILGKRDSWSEMVDYAKAQRRSLADVVTDKQRARAAAERRRRAADRYRRDTDQPRPLP